MRKTALLIDCIVAWFVHTQGAVELPVGGQTIRTDGLRAHSRKLPYIFNSAVSINLVSSIIYILISQRDKN